MILHLKSLLTILLFFGLFKSSFACCASDDRTLTEKLFNGTTETIFTCEILTMTRPKDDNLFMPSKEKSNGTITRETIGSSTGNIDGISTVKIIQVYFGIVDSNIITLNTGSFLKVGETYLIYTNGYKKPFSCGGVCDRWTKQVTNSPDSKNEMKLLQQFSEIFKYKTSGNFSFANSENILLAEGKFYQGKPVKTWNHYYENGEIKSKYDIENKSTTQYSPNGFIKTHSINGKEKSEYLTYSDKVNGRVKYKIEEIPNDTGNIMVTYSYFDNGTIENVNGQVNVNLPVGGTYAIHTGVYEEYYDNGNVKLKGQFYHNKRIGLWKWFYANGEFNIEFDYKDGTGGQ